MLNSHTGRGAATAHSAEVERRPVTGSPATAAAPDDVTACLGRPGESPASCSADTETPPPAVDLENATSSPMPEGCVKEGEKVKIRESKDKVEKMDKRVRAG